MTGWINLMKADWKGFKRHFDTGVRTANCHKRLLAIVAALVFLQLYFVRELIAAELLFGVGFAFLLVLVGVLYGVGAIGERGLEWSEAGARMIAHSTHRIYTRISPVVRAAGYLAMPVQQETPPPVPDDPSFPPSDPEPHLLPINPEPQPFPL